MKKTDGRKADLEHKQISAMRTPKMEPESSKWLRRTSKKGPMSQQWRHLGNGRHLRKHKRRQRGPWKGQMEPQRPLGAEKQAKMGPTGVQRGGKKESK